VARNIANVQGVKELAAKVKALNSAMAGQKAYKVMASAAFIGANAIKRSPNFANLPKEMRQQAKEEMTAPFVFARPGNRATVTALLGLRKRGKSRPYASGYVEWGKRGPKIVGESLATMFEKGTKHMQPLPWFRPAIEGSKAAMRERIKEGLQQIINEAATK
jgi:hypothetical protein